MKQQTNLQEFGRGSFGFYKNGAEMAPQYKWEAEASGKSCQVKKVYYKKTKMPGAP